MKVVWEHKGGTTVWELCNGRKVICYFLSEREAICTRRHMADCIPEARWLLHKRTGSRRHD